MAKAFNTLKDPKLQLTDKLPFGKFAGCRICDIIDEDWEYLQWLHKNTSISFGQQVLDKITQLWLYEDLEQHKREELEPWQTTGVYFSPDTDSIDDVPF